MEKLKKTDVDFDALNASQEKWTDTDFPTTDALFWKDVGEGGGAADVKVEWKRISENGFGVKSLWGENGKSSINPTDMNQG